MLDNSDTNPRQLQQRRTHEQNFGAAEELGVHVCRIAALLRAAVNTGPDEREDEAWLVGMAHEEVVRAQERYRAWAGAPAGEAA